MLTAAGLAEDVAQAAGSAVEARRADVLPALKANSASIAQAHLRDFDWRVQVSGRNSFCLLKPSFIFCSVWSQFKVGKTSLPLALARFELAPFVRTQEYFVGI